MKKILLLFICIVSISSHSQDGSLDTSFGLNGIVVTDLGGNSQDYGYNVVAQLDQKLIVAGYTHSAADGSNSFLIRYMPDGSVDTNFGTDGVVIFSGPALYGIDYLFLDSQQHIIAAGRAVQGSDFVMAKYLSDGTLDNNYGNNGIVVIPDGIFSQITFLDDGSVLLLKFSGSNEITINHYLSNGDLDTDFGINGTATSVFSGGTFSRQELKVNAQGHIFLLGTRDNIANADIILMKFGADGYLDPNFATNGMATKNIDAMNPMNFSDASMDFTNDNKIVIAGTAGACVDIGNSEMQPFFLKYLIDGMPDSSFGNNGTVLLPVSGTRYSDFIIQENQRMLVSGKFLDCFEGSVYTINRYFSGGTLDTSFIGAGFEFDNYKTILLQDGKIVTVGNTFWYNGPENIILVRHNNTALSVPEFKNQKTVVFPNPSSGIFTIESKSFSETHKYQITDMTGKIISHGELGDRQTQLNLSSAQSGVYFLTISNNVFRLLKN